MKHVVTATDKNPAYSEAAGMFKAALLCFLVVVLLGVASLARASDATVESVDGNVVTLDNGDTVQVTSPEDVHVGDGVEIDKTYTFDNGAEGEEY
ncbi:UNVERIFIED_CONTAM: hypothetical protein RF648_20125 [Kocuria sp. CPCC 205274]